MTSILIIVTYDVAVFDDNRLSWCHLWRNFCYFLMSCLVIDDISSGVGAIYDVICCLMTSFLELTLMLEQVSVSEYGSYLLFMCHKRFAQVLLYGFCTFWYIFLPHASFRLQAILTYFQYGCHTLSLHRSSAFTRVLPAWVLDFVLM